jgi:hypothetical protein
VVSRVYSPVPCLVVKYIVRTDSVEAGKLEGSHETDQYVISTH